MTPEEIAKKIMRLLDPDSNGPAIPAVEREIVRAIYEARHDGAKSYVGYGSTPNMTLVSADDRGGVKLAPVKGHVLDDAGVVIAGEWKTWASIVEDVRTTHTAFIPTDQTAAAARTPEAPDARERKR